MGGYLEKNLMGGSLFSATFATFTENTDSPRSFLPEKDPEACATLLPFMLPHPQACATSMRKNVLRPSLTHWRSQRPMLPCYPQGNNGGGGWYESITCTATHPYFVTPKCLYVLLGCSEKLRRISSSSHKRRRREERIEVVVGGLFLRIVIRGER